MNLQASYTIANLTQSNIVRTPIIEQFCGLEQSDGHTCTSSDGRNQSDHLEPNDAVTHTDSYLDILCDILCCCELWLSEFDHIIKESEATKHDDPEIDISDTEKNVAPGTADSSEVAPDCLKHDTGCLIRDVHDQFVLNLEVFIMASEGWLHDVCEMFNITRDLFADTAATTVSTVTTETAATAIMTILHPEEIHTLCSNGEVLLDDEKDLEPQSQLTYGKPPIIEWSISQLPTTQVGRRQEGGRHTSSQLMTEGDWNEGKELGTAVEKDKNEDVYKDKDDEVDEHGEKDGHVDVEKKNDDDKEYNRDNDGRCIGVTCTYADEHGEVTSYTKSDQLHDSMSNTCNFTVKHEDQEAIDNAQTSGIHVQNSEINLVPESFEDQIKENAESTLSFSTVFDSEQHVTSDFIKSQKLPLNNVSKLSRYFEAERDQMTCCDTTFSHEVHRLKEGDPTSELQSCNMIPLVPEQLSDDNVRLPCNQQVIDSNHKKISGNTRSQSASLQILEEDWDAGKALDKVVDQDKNTDVDENDGDDIDKDSDDDRDEYGNDHGDYVVDQNRDEDKVWDRNNDEQKIEVEYIDNDEDGDTTRCIDSDKLKESMLNKCNFIDTCIDKQAMDDAQTCLTSDSEITPAPESYDDQIEESSEPTLSLGTALESERHVTPECIKSQKLLLNNVSELSQYFTKEDHSECLEAELDQVICCETTCDHEVHRLNENDSTTELQIRDMFQLVPEQLSDDDAPCNQQMMNFSHDKSSGNSRSPSLFSLDLLNSDSNDGHEIKSAPDDHSGVFQIDHEQMEQRSSSEGTMLQMVPNSKDDDIIGYNEMMNMLSLQPTATTTASEATRIDSNNYQHDDTSAMNLSAYDNSPTSLSRHNHNQYAVPAHSVKEFQQLTNLAKKKQDVDEDEKIQCTQAFDLGLYGKYTTLKIVQDILFDLVDHAIELSVDCTEPEISLTQYRLDEYEDDTLSLVPSMGSRHDPMLSQGFAYEDNVFATQPFKPQPVRQPYQLSQEKPYQAETNYPSGSPNTNVVTLLDPDPIHDNPDSPTVSDSACVNVNIAYPTSKPPKVRRLNDQLVPGSNPSTRDEESFHHLRGKTERQHKMNSN